MGYHYFDGDTFEREGHTFRVTHPLDDSTDAPWERADGHGPVSKWTRNAKRPGERVLCSDRGAQRYYDWQAACKLARRDGWDADPIGAPNRIERAVQADFDFLRGWCNDEWQYVGVVVELLDAEDEPIDKNSLWGIESDSYDYLRDTAHELADQLLHAHGLTLTQRTQAWRGALREARERRYWAQRDTITT